MTTKLLAPKPLGYTVAGVATLMGLGMFLTGLVGGQDNATKRSFVLAGGSLMLASLASAVLLADQP